MGRTDTQRYPSKRSTKAWRNRPKHYAVYKPRTTRSKTLKSSLVTQSAGLLKDTYGVSVQSVHFAWKLLKLKNRKQPRGLKTSQTENSQHSRRAGNHNTDVRRSSRGRLTSGGAVAEGCRKGVKCWWVCVCWCWWLCWWNWKANGGTFWDVLPDELDDEFGADGPPGVLRPAAAELFSAPGTLRLPSRSGGNQDLCLESIRGNKTLNNLAI